MNELVRLDQIERRLRRRLAAIAFLDVVGYSRLMAISEEATLDTGRVLRHSVIEPRILAWRGRVVDRAGDGIFAEFGSALEALHWAADVQEAAEQHPSPGEKMKLRIAVHLADVIDGPDGEVQGDGVNTAARLQSYAEPGGVIVSQAVVDAVQGKTDAVFADLGLIPLANPIYPVHAFRLCAKPSSMASVSISQYMPRVAVAAIAVSLLLLIPVFNWHTTAREQAEHLVQEGRAIKCPRFPCGRTWLESRTFYEHAIEADPTFARAYAEASLTYANFLSARLSSTFRRSLFELTGSASHRTTQNVRCQAA